MFYYEENMVSKRMNSLCDFTPSMIKKDHQNLLMVRKWDLQKPECKKLIKENNFVFIEQSYPKWTEKLNKYYMPKFNQAIVELYELNK